MLITIENFGAIKHFEFDTEKDMYLIFGKNSMGKSYAISLVYLILKNIIALNTKSFIYPKIDIKEVDIKLKKSNTKKIDLSDNVKYTLMSHIKDFFLDNLNSSIANTFNDINNLENKFSNKKLVIKIDLGSVDLPLEIKIGRKSNSSKFEIINFNLKKEFILKRNQRCLGLNYDNEFNECVLYFPEGKESHFKSSYESLMYLLKSKLFRNFHSISNVYYLPASRSGLYQALSAFGQIFAELAKQRTSISKAVEIPAIPEPFSDYFLELSNIDISKNNDLFSYAEEIEKEILQGLVKFDKNTKRLLFVPDKTNLKLDLSATSSMVSEISPIVYYLKYILPNNSSSKQKPLIFIEEPEAHLHPEVQIKLMDVFARLVKDDKIKIVITSHSNYIFNKASNLVIDNKIDKQQLKSILFKNTPEGSVAEDLETDEYGIEDNNFIDVAESLYEEKIELINKLNGQQYV